MPEQWEYVAVSYAATAVTLGAWLAFMLPKLRKLTRRDEVER